MSQNWEIDDLELRFKTENAVIKNWESNWEVNDPISGVKIEKSMIYNQDTDSKLVNEGSRTKIPSWEIKD